MHRPLLALAALVLIVSCIASCNEEEPAALFADLSYQLRCLDCNPVAPDGPKHDLSVAEGDDVSLSCEVVNGAISLAIEGDGFLFRVLRALPGDDPGGQCQVQVAENNANEYRGGCKGIDDDGSNPCEVELTIEGSGFSGTVECHGIQNRNIAVDIRHVVAPGTIDKPAQISAQGCSGL